MVENFSYRNPDLDKKDHPPNPIISSAGAIGKKLSTVKKKRKKVKATGLRGKCST